MKILLIGEFSGVHNNLKKGLVELGHEVTLAADGDGYRGFDSDIKLKPFKTTKGQSWAVRLGIHIKNILHFILNYRIFFGNDIVQFISPFSIQSTYSFITFLILKYNKKSFYYACGTDPAFLDSENYFDYFPFDDMSSPEYPKYSKSYKNYYNKFTTNIDRIVPAMYGYSVGYIGNNKLDSPIKLPIIQGATNETVKQNSKIIILHGITRYDFKGSKFIIEAMNRIAIEYPELVEVMIVEKIPFNEYYKLYQRVDVVVDQCKSYDYGMNALNALSHGKIVLSGAEKVAMDYIGIKTTPIINIIPDSDQIYDSLKKIIDMRAIELDEIKNKGINYSFANHNYLKIANEFINKYNRK